MIPRLKGVKLLQYFTPLTNFKKKSKIMIQNIKELLQNTQLQQQVKAAANLAEAIKLITTVGVEKGYSFTQESVAQAISGLMLEEHELSEAELQAVAGGRYCAETGPPPTEECGGGGGPFHTGLSSLIFGCNC